MELKVTEVDVRQDRKWGYYSQGRWYTNRRSSELPTGHSIAYVDVKGETLWDDFANRTSRPYKVWKPLVEQALRDAGVEFTGLRWSQKAGCSCSCSPGFIVQGNVGRDIWVSIEADEPQRTDENAAMQRVEALINDPTIPVG